MPKRTATLIESSLQHLEICSLFTDNIPKNLRVVMIIVCLQHKPPIIKSSCHIPLEVVGLRISLFRQVENHHHHFLSKKKNHHLVDRANPFVYSLKQWIHLQPNKRCNGFPIKRKEEKNKHGYDVPCQTWILEEESGSLEIFSQK